MMPLPLAAVGEELMGFVAGANVTVISEIAGNLIVNVKESRIALDKEMAMKIFVQ